MAVALLVALLVVLVTGGSFRRLAGVRLAYPGLLLGGFGLQIAAVSLPLPETRVGDVGFGLLLSSYVLILGFGIANLRLRSMGIVVIGVAMNALVIALNGGMPYRPPAGAEAVTTVKHRPERPGDLLTVLDDRILVRSPVNQLLSFGDLVLAVGLVAVCYRAARPVGRRVEPAPRHGARRPSDTGSGAPAMAHSARRGSSRRASTRSRAVTTRTS